MRNKIFPSSLVRKSEDFWKNSSIKFRVPCPLDESIEVDFPVVLQTIKDLSLVAVYDWCKQNRIEIELPEKERKLHGTLIARNGKGIIFLNDSGNSFEWRFTLAHEIAHFLLDYYYPRKRAIANIGPKIVEVLDGIREPTSEELYGGYLKGISLSSGTHLIERTGDGSFEYLSNWNAENRADLFASLLMAPLKDVIKRMKSVSNTNDFNSYKKGVINILRDEFQLGSPICDLYGSKIAYYVKGGPSLLSKFGL